MLVSSCQEPNSQRNSRKGRENKTYRTAEFHVLPVLNHDDCCDYDGHQHCQWRSYRDRQGDRQQRHRDESFPKAERGTDQRRDEDHGKHIDRNWGGQRLPPRYVTARLPEFQHQECGQNSLRSCASCIRKALVATSRPPQPGRADILSCHNLVTPGETKGAKHVEKPLPDQTEAPQSFRQTQRLEAYCRKHGQNQTTRTSFEPNQIGHHHAALTSR